MLRLRNLALWLSLACLAGLTGTAFAQELPEGRLMRFPDVYKGKIVFSYAGDLWLGSSQGGTAQRITTHPGLELFPKFSPDGKWIAFTAQYDGNFNVYVMPSDGGEPRQLTFLPDPVHLPERMGPNNEVITWFPDSKRILFLSRRDTFNDWFGRLFSVSIDGGLPVRLPIDKGGLTSFSADGTKIAYNRIFRNFRTWKRYRGGMGQDIALYDFKTNHYERLTDYPGTDSFPMWHGDTIYFTSDRGEDHRLNLYALDLKSRQTRQLTHFTEFDVMWPSLGPDSIIFENGGYLYLFDLASEKERKLTLYLPGDRDEARPHWANVAGLITDFDIAPDGKRAVFAARGDVFTVPAEHGSTRNLTQTPGIRERYVAWSPDGKWVAYVSDRTGEDELYITPQDGTGPEQRITSDGAVTRYGIAWSPDSKKLVYADKNLKLWYVDIDKKQPMLVDQGKYFEIRNYSWSPDSNWIAYDKSEENRYSVIYLYSLVDQKITPVTSNFYNSNGAVFDPDGKYLYFFSDRDFNEVVGNFDTVAFANPKTTRVYVVTLRADVPSPFAPQSDEVEIKKAAADQKPDASAKDEMKSEEKKEAFRIDLQGIANRIVALPIPASNMGAIAAGSDRVYYLTFPIFGLDGPLPGESSAIRVYDFKERKSSVLLAGATGMALSMDGKKLLYQAPKQGGGDAGGANSTFGIIDTTPIQAHKVGDGGLDLSGLRMEIDPRAEYRQMFFEVYRQERDFFFESSMNGVDWAKERDKYAQLLPYIADRYDLNYVIGEFIGELANSHTYTGGGDYPNLHPVNVGVLGVDFELDAASGRYRIKKIYPGENWNADFRSPLTEPGVNVKEGDYLLAVNSRPLKAPQNPYELFINTGGENTVLTVNSKPSDDGSRTVTVQPIESEYNLRQFDMISTNREKVDKASGGQIGYVYIPNMEGDGLDAFVRQWYPQIRKQGMIFDVRYNGGGFVDQIIFERLRRILAGMEDARNWEPGTIPDEVFHGYMAAITNEYAASDGDYFSYFFKQYHLGPLIGMRTWGGVRGIRGGIPLMDGGYVTRPEFSLYGLSSEWVIENRGVAPDVEVDNTPDQVMAGKDPQLEKAIELLMKEIKDNPKKLAPRPPDLPPYPKGPGL